MRRGIFAEALPAGDDALSTSGLTWNVDRTNASGSVLRVIAGERNKPLAVLRLLEMAEDDGTDAWESLGRASYKLIKRHRARTAEPTRAQPEASR
jgi:hypothetical protein